MPMVTQTFQGCRVLQKAPNHKLSKHPNHVVHLFIYLFIYSLFKVDLYITLRKVFQVM